MGRSLSFSPDSLPSLLASRLADALPGRSAQERFAPELSYGRHHGRPPHDARDAAVVVLLYPYRLNWHVLLTIRSERLSSHAGQISFPGGRVDPGESSQQAALRELQEELGFCGRAVEFLGRLSRLYLFNSNFVLTPWVACAPHRIAWLPNPDEVSGILEVPLADLANRNRCGWHRISVGNWFYRAPHILWNGHRIWGGTAMILGEVIELLGQVTRPGRTDLFNYRGCATDVVNRAADY